MFQIMSRVFRFDNRGGRAKPEMVTPISVQLLPPMLNYSSNRQIWPKKPTRDAKAGCNFQIYMATRREIKRKASSTHMTAGQQGDKSLLPALKLDRNFSGGKVTTGECFIRAREVSGCPRGPAAAALDRQHRAQLRTARQLCFQW